MRQKEKQHNNAQYINEYRLHIGVIDKFPHYNKRFGVNSLLVNNHIYVCFFVLKASRIIFPPGCSVLCVVPYCKVCERLRCKYFLKKLKRETRKLSFCD